MSDFKMHKPPSSKTEKTQTHAGLNETVTPELLKKAEDALLDEKNAQSTKTSKETEPKMVKEIGGRDGPEATRYGDWELKGRCIDF